MKTEPPTRTDLELEGHAGVLRGTRWSASGGREPSYVAVLVHGYGEHVGRYEHVAARLVADGAVVHALDHVGHGRSDGERVLVVDFEPVVADVHLLVERARAEHPGLPVVLVGHSMGGLIGARHAQLHPAELACVVLTGPVLGSWGGVTELLGLDEIPATPIDPSTLSRDPAVGAAYEADVLVWHGDFKRPTIEALLAAMETVTSGGRLSVPTLWLHGEADQLVPIEATRAGWGSIRADDGEERSFTAARHEILNETNQDEVLDVALEFVHRHL